MGIKDTVLGWLRSTPTDSEELEDAEADEAEREYAAEKADEIAANRFRSRPGEFESDQDAPRR